VNNTSARGQSVFLGAAATGGDVFTELRISSVSSSPIDSNFIIFGPATFAAATAVSVPEPAGIAVLWLLVAAFLIREGRRVVSGK
jgi:hypothetical protein